MQRTKPPWRDHNSFAVATGVCTVSYTSTVSWPTHDDILSPVLFRIFFGHLSRRSLLVIEYERTLSSATFRLFYLPADSEESTDHLATVLVGKC